MGVDRNPRDSMRSSWRTGDKRDWGHGAWLLHLLDVHPTDLAREVPVYKKSDRMPYLSHRSCHLWIVVHAAWPLLAHQAYIAYTGSNMHAAAAFTLYSTAFVLNAVQQLQILRNLGQKYGFLDGEKHARDQVPDHSTNKVVHSLLLTASARPMITVMLAWNGQKTPADLSWSLPLEIGLYGIILDFWFYWYHRLMHEVDFFWKFHRTHHLTKHPNPLLTLYADFEQEMFDIMIIPLLTYLTLRFLGFPMTFYDWWVCHQYMAFSELLGHSGVRIYTTTISTHSLFLRLFNAELASEDHDLHHRQGWKRSMNYGKQTLLWDRVFGTAGKRIEFLPENTDFTSRVAIPLFGVQSSEKAA